MSALCLQWFNTSNIVSSSIAADKNVLHDAMNELTNKLPVEYIKLINVTVLTIYYLLLV